MLELKACLPSLNLRFFKARLSARKATPSPRGLTKIHYNKRPPTKLPNCTPHLTANPIPLASLFPLPEGQQLPVSTMELSGENSDSHMDSPPPPKRKYTFGMYAPLPPGRSDFGMRKLLSKEPEDESGKHALHSTGLNMISAWMRHLPRASTRFWHAGDTLAVSRTKAWLFQA